MLELYTRQGTRPFCGTVRFPIEYTRVEACPYHACRRIRECLPGSHCGRLENVFTEMNDAYVRHVRGRSMTSMLQVDRLRLWISRGSIMTIEHYSDFRSQLEPKNVRFSTMLTCSTPYAEQCL
jgi:hypothetical protein